MNGERLFWLGLAIVFAAASAVMAVDGIYYGHGTKPIVLAGVCLFGAVACVWNFRSNR